jgi:hypothetical protein
LKREGSWRKTAERNIDIIELVKKIESEQRLATPEEQALLVKWTGWGASEIAQDLFPVARYGDDKDTISVEYARAEWKPLISRIVALLSPEELRTALASRRMDAKR